MNKNNLITAALYGILFLSFHQAQAQQNEVDTTVDLDVLTVPNSPALNLLGTSAATVDIPTSPNDFAFSIANATNNFSQLPKNYAVEFLPLNMFSGKIKLSNTFISNQLAHNILHTFTVSAGLSTDESVDTSVAGFIRTHTGLGFRVSLLRGDIDTAFKDYADNVENIRGYLRALHDRNSAIIDSFRNNDPLYLEFGDKRTALLSNARKTGFQMIDLNKRLEQSPDNPVIADSLKILDILSLQLRDSLDKLSPVAENLVNQFKERKQKEVTEEAMALKKAIEETKFKREGWLLDFAGGFVTGFRNDDFQNSIVERYAFWLNGGYSKGKFNIMGLARYNTNLGIGRDANGKKINEGMFDAGGKLEYESDDKKFSLNGEITGRFLKDTTVFKYSINAGYQVGKNQALTFSVGKNFAGGAYTGGNLIAALNFIKSFGSKRTIAPAKQPVN